MNKNQSLDNETIAKLAIAIATAMKLKDDGEVPGPLARKVLETLETLDSMPHLVRHRPNI